MEKIGLLKRHRNDRNFQFFVESHVIIGREDFGRGHGRIIVLKMNVEQTSLFLPSIEVICFFCSVA